MKHPSKIAVALCAVAALTGIAIAAGSTAVAYPEGYRTWRHVKSMVIGQGHPLYDAFGGIHHLYANQKAVAGYRSGKFADGAIIVFDLLAVNSADGAITEGARKVVGVMQREVRGHRRLGIRGLCWRQQDAARGRRQCQNRLL
jgi:hypothetical protein